MNIHEFRFETDHIGRCPLCGSENREMHISLPAVCGNTSVFFRCADCGLVYMDPIPTEESLAGFYGRIYTDPEFRKIDGHSIADPVQEFAAAFAVVEKHLDSIEQHKQPPGAMLDIGCAYGGILIEASTRGWQTRGIEPSGEAVKFCRENLLLDVTAEGIMEASLPEEAFDVIVMLEVIEHVHKPVEAMKRAARLAKSGGIVYLTCPNASSPAALLMREQWQGWKPPTHLQFFSYYTLRKLFDETGWEPVCLKSGSGYPGQLSAVAKKKG